MLNRYIYAYIGLILLVPITTLVQWASAIIQADKVFLSTFYNLSSFEQNPTKDSLMDTNLLFESVQDIVVYCGFGNKLTRLTRYRTKRYAFLGSFWNKTDLTYTIEMHPKSLSKREVDGEIARAFALWSEHTDLTFTFKKHCPVDIKISKHGNCNPLDTKRGVLAHSFPPGTSTEIHFYKNVNWTVGSHWGINLLQVSTHEIGHALGLNHSEFLPAAMNLCYKGYDPDFKLHEDDIAAIQALYGKKTQPDPRFCNDPKFDTIFSTTHMRVYIFKGENYFKIKHNIIAHGYPKLIKDGWPGLPGDIDAAFTHPNNKTYFFKNDVFWCYDERKLEGTYPKKIVEEFIGIPTHLDTALADRDNNIIYFFKGSDYWHYDLAGSRKVKENYPKPISNWKGLPNHLDAALQHPNGYRYFFKDDKYYRLNKEIGSIDSAVPPYPRPIADYWFGCKLVKKNRKISGLQYRTYNNEKVCHISIPKLNYIKQNIN